MDGSHECINGKKKQCQCFVTASHFSNTGKCLGQARVWQVAFFYKLKKLNYIKLHNTEWNYKQIKSQTNCNHWTIVHLRLVQSLCFALSHITSHHHWLFRYSCTPCCVLFLHFLLLSYTLCLKSLTHPLLINYKGTMLRLHVVTWKTCRSSHMVRSEL